MVSCFPGGSDKHRRSTSRRGLDEEGAPSRDCEGANKRGPLSMLDPAGDVYEKMLAREHRPPDAREANETSRIAEFFQRIGAI